MPQKITCSLQVNAYECRLNEFAIASEDEYIAQIEILIQQVE